MSVVLTYAGESLIARLQAEGQPLVIDKFIFANVPGQDHTAPVDPALGVPAGVVHEFPIPPEYRAFVTPNQVVYSALLGSDIGPFTFNWQGLYCSAHDVLVAVATFPALEKRAYDPNTNTQGNNLTRNFLLEFSGARELTQITVEAGVWQIDFTVRLKGIDERERLSNVDLYGRAAFLDDGWLLTRNAGSYRFEAGRGYVEGIRAALAEPLVVAPSLTPCDVWLDVSLQRQGSDVVAAVSPLFLDPAAPAADYMEGAPYNTPHYCVKVASIAADGAVTDRRPLGMAISAEQVGAATPQQLEDEALARQNHEEDSSAHGAGRLRLTALTGGAAGALDAIPRASITDGELAVVDTAGLLSLWRFHAGSSAAEDGTTVVSPDDAGASPGRWHRARMGADDTGGVPIGTLDYNVIPGYEPPLYIATSGQLLLRADYPELWVLVEPGAVSEEDWPNDMQGCFSVGDGLTTFRAPLIDAEFVRALDRGRGVDAGRTHGSTQLDAMQPITGHFASNTSLDGIAANSTGAFTLGGGTGRREGDASGPNYTAVYFDSGRVTRTATETRTRNIAYPAWIKYA